MSFAWQSQGGSVSALALDRLDDRASNNKAISRFTPETAMRYIFSTSSFRRGLAGRLPELVAVGPAYHDLAVVVAFPCLRC